MNGVRIQKTLGIIAPPKKNKENENNGGEDENNDDEGTDLADDEQTVLDAEQDHLKTRERKSKKDTKVNTEEKTIEEEVIGSTETITLDIGDLYSEEVKKEPYFKGKNSLLTNCNQARDVVLRLYVPATNTSTDAFELAQVKLTYVNPRSNNETCERSISCTVQRKDQVSAEEKVRSYEVDKQINRLVVADCMEAAKNEASAGNLEKARQMLRDTMNVIKQSVSSKDLLCQGLLSDLQQIFDSFKSEQTWNNFGSKIGRAHV